MKKMYISAVEKLAARMAAYAQKRTERSIDRMMLISSILGSAAEVAKATSCIFKELAKESEAQNKRLYMAVMTADGSELKALWNEQVARGLEIGLRVHTN